MKLDLFKTNGCSPPVHVRSEALLFQAAVPDKDAEKWLVTLLAGIAGEEVAVGRETPRSPLNSRDGPGGTIVCTANSRTMCCPRGIKSMSGIGKLKDFGLGRAYTRIKVSSLDSLSFSQAQDLDFSIFQFPRHIDKEDIREELMRPEHSAVPPGVQIRNLKGYGRAK